MNTTFKLYYKPKKKWYINNSVNRKRLRQNPRKWKLGSGLMISPKNRIVKKTKRNLAINKKYLDKKRAKKYSGGFYLKYSLISRRGRIRKEHGRYIPINRREKKEFKQIIKMAIERLQNDYPIFKSKRKQVQHIKISDWNVENFKKKSAKLPVFGKYINHNMSKLYIDPNAPNTSENYNCLPENIWYQASEKIKKSKATPKRPYYIESAKDLVTFINHHRYIKSKNTIVPYKTIKQTKGCNINDIKAIENEFDLLIRIFDIYLNKWIFTDKQKIIRHIKNVNNIVYLLGHDRHVFSIKKEYKNKIKSNNFKVKLDSDLQPTYNLHIPYKCKHVSVKSLKRAYRNHLKYKMRDNKNMVIWTFIHFKNDNTLIQKLVKKYKADVFKYKGNILNIKFPNNIIIKNLQGFNINIKEDYINDFKTAKKICKLLNININEVSSYSGLSLRLFTNTLKYNISNLSVDQRNYLKSFRCGGVNKIYQNEYYCQEDEVIIEIDKKNAYPEASLEKLFPKFLEIDTLQEYQDNGNLLQGEGFARIILDNTDPHIIEYYELFPYGTHDYTFQQVNYGRKMNIPFKITHILKASSIYKNIFNKHVNTLYKRIKKYPEYKKEFKRILNSLSGILKCDEKPVKVVLTRSKAEASRLYFNSKQQFLRIFNAGGEKFYEVGYNNTNNRSLPHLYNYILGYHTISMYKLYKDLEKLDVIFLQKITDCYQIVIKKNKLSLLKEISEKHKCSIKFKDGIDFIGWGCRNYRINTTFKKSSVKKTKNRFYGIKNPHPSDSYYHFQYTPYTFSETNIKEYIDKTDYTHPYLKLSKTHQKIAIIGPPGSGKSYQLKLVTQELKKLCKKYDILTPSGISAKNVDGQTIESKIGFRKSKSFSINVMKPVDFVLIDEFSMISQERFNIFYDIYLTLNRHTCFIFFGDPSQLIHPDNGHSILLDDFHKEYLHKIWRQKDVEFIEHIKNVLNTGVYKGNNNITNDYRLILAGTNYQCELFNKKYHKQFKNKNTEHFVFRAKLWGNIFYHKQFKHYLNKEGFNKVKVYIGEQFMIKENIYDKDKKRLFVNGQMIKITGFNKKSIKFRTINRETFELSDKIYTLSMQIRKKKASNDYQKKYESFCKYLPISPCFAVTIHKVQSLTIYYNYAIHWKSLWDNKLKYVAISRAVNPEQITIL